MSLKQAVAAYLDDTNAEQGGWVTGAIASLILLSAVIFVVETYPIAHRWQLAVTVVDWGILGLFTLEYGLRCWSSPVPWRYALSLYGLIDLVAILPFVLGLLDMRFLRLLRWLRILRLARLLGDRAILGRLTAADTLAVARIVFTLSAIIFIYAGIIFQVEQRYHPDTFQSFFEAAYFAIVTITTVGYGDITPASDAGRLFTMLMILTGIALVPTQLGNLIRQIVKVSQAVQIPCGQCGWAAHDPDARFCKRCGAALPVAEVPTQEPQETAPPLSTVPLPFAPRPTTPASATAGDPLPKEGEPNSED